MHKKSVELFRNDASYVFLSQQEQRLDAESISCGDEFSHAYDVSSDPLYDDLFRSVSFPLEQSPVMCCFIVCDAGFAESQILRDQAELNQPSNIRIGSDGSNCRTNLATISPLVQKTDYKTPVNLFTAEAGGSNNVYFLNAIN